MEMTRLRKRLAAEEGTALIIALMATMLLTALGAAMIMVTTTETKISNNFSDAQEALYAADAAVERVVQDLLMVPRWNDSFTGVATSGFIDGAAGAVRAGAMGRGAAMERHPDRFGAVLIRRRRHDRAEAVDRRRHRHALLRYEFGNRSASDGDRPVEHVGRQ